MPTPTLPLRVAKPGINHLKREIVPVFPTGIGERYSQTISKLGHAALLRRCELPRSPPINESAELTQGSLLLIHYSEVTGCVRVLTKLEVNYINKLILEIGRPKTTYPKPNIR